MKSANDIVHGCTAHAVLVADAACVASAVPMPMPQFMTLSGEDEAQRHGTLLLSYFQNPSA